MHTYSSVYSTMFPYQPLCLLLPQYCKFTKKRSNKYANFTIFSFSFICFVHLFYSIHRKILVFFLLLLYSAIGLLLDLPLLYVVLFENFFFQNENGYVSALVVNFFFFIFFFSPCLLVECWLVYPTTMTTMTSSSTLNIHSERTKYIAQVSQLVYGFHGSVRFSGMFSLFAAL